VNGLLFDTVSAGAAAVLLVLATCGKSLHAGHMLLAGGAVVGVLLAVLITCLSNGTPTVPIALAPVIAAVALLALARQARDTLGFVLGGAAVLLTLMGMDLAESDAAPALVAESWRPLLATAVALFFIARPPRRFAEWSALHGRALILGGACLYGVGALLGLQAGTQRTSLAVGGSELVIADVARAAVTLGVGLEVAVRRTSWRLLGRGASVVRVGGPTLAAVLVSGVLAVATGDVGGAMLLSASVLIVIAMSAERWWPLLAGATGVCAALVGSTLISARAAARVGLWLHPPERLADSQVGLIHLGLLDGGALGAGLGAAPTHLVPAVATDARLLGSAQAIGVIGCLALVAILLSLLIALCRIANVAIDGLGAAMVLTVATLIGVEAVENLGGTTGMLILTGVPFPFLSRGGTSLVLDCLLVALATTTVRGSRGTHGPGARS
jgi:cell division protein FtsW (lipid II flippase)